MSPRSGQAVCHRDVRVVVAPRRDHPDGWPIFARWVATDDHDLVLLAELSEATRA
jgi:hypothetical protein